MIKITDKIIEDAIQGDQDAISLLYQCSYDSVYSTIKCIIRYDEDTVLDLVQDTFLRAMTHLHQLREAEKFLPWINKIAANTTKNYLKRKKAVLFTDLVSEEEDQEYQVEDTSVEFRPEVQMDQQETKRLMDEILDSLSDEQRLSIIMFHYNDMSIKEIAQEFGCSENTVKSRLNYGRAKIEGKVKELSKKGTKLYGFTPFPFFLFLLRSKDSQAAVLPTGRMLDTVLKAREIRLMNMANVTKEGAKIATANVTKEGAKLATANVTKEGATVASKVVSTKLIASLVSIGIVGAGIAAYPILKNTFAPKEPAVVVESTQETESTFAEATTEEATDRYTFTEEEIQALWDSAVAGWENEDRYITLISEDKTYETSDPFISANENAESTTLSLYDGEELRFQGEVNLDTHMWSHELPAYYINYAMLKEKITEAGDVSAEEYEAEMATYEEQYRCLGDGLLGCLVYRTDGIHTYGIACREYDVDEDGKDELLLGYSTSPSRATIFAFYRGDGSCVLGDELSYYDMPEDNMTENSWSEYLILE